MSRLSSISKASCKHRFSFETSIRRLSLDVERIARVFTYGVSEIGVIGDEGVTLRDPVVRYSFVSCIVDSW